MTVERLPTGDGGRDPRRVGDALDRVVRFLGAPRADTVAAVFSGWEELVGARVAAHARPLALRDGALVVAVDDAAWASQLQWLEADLLARVGERVGEPIDRLEVRVRPAGDRD